ncbi:MAG: STAS domain-containing protein [Bacteroidia bacterium]|nr:STAS domain-containing protein [Bacteroidia bacterium]
MLFTYQSNSKNSIKTIHMKGELVDRNQGTELMSEVEDSISKGEVKIILNLNDLKYLNSSGLNILINILTKSRKAGGDVAICNVNKKISELLVITKLNSVFNVSDTEDAAIKILNQ